MFEINERVRISGNIKYGDQDIKVSSQGTIVDVEKNSFLVSIDMIDGDSNAWVYVNKDCIFNI
ncbi:MULTISPECIES: hypothetical protein [unclassified Clostridium]|uniref:hypothetical protein n=1 Tax=unclassified Clostridium TaxID=2614128 RepID=UPI0025BFA79B|nr:MULTISPECIES: hypothetical protein [unclassified Clostridium]